MLGGRIDCHGGKQQRAQPCPDGPANPVYVKRGQGQIVAPLGCRLKESYQLWQHRLPPRFTPAVASRSSCNVAFTRAQVAVRSPEMSSKDATLMATLMAPSRPSPPCAKGLSALAKRRAAAVALFTG